MGGGNLQILHYKKEYEIKNPRNFVGFTSKGMAHSGWDLYQTPPYIYITFLVCLSISRGKEMRRAK